MKKLCSTYLIFLACLCLAAPALAARGSWSLDQAKFHASAHGQLSCTECHEDLSGAKGHPDPAKLKLDPKAGFNAENCTKCHDGVGDKLEQGMHGGRKVKDLKRFETCIACHDPHIQPPLKSDYQKPLAKGVPRSRQCAACHDEQKALPAPSEEDRTCYLCHVSPVEGGAKEATRQKALCLECHASYAKPTGASRFDPMQLAKGPHAEITCLQCHKNADRFPHASEARVDCTQCHSRLHDESVAGDLHMGVSCQACHMQGMEAVRPSAGGPVMARVMHADGMTKAHLLADAKHEETCARCHHPGNKLGVAAMALPQKSIMCMPCHAATFSVDPTDYVSLIGLGLFVLGMAGAVSFWSSGLGGALGSIFRALFSARIGRIIKAFVLDGLLQRRLWRVSPARGLIHALIFLPFLFRFTWGLVALVASLWLPEYALGWDMLHKNHPLTAFVFDLSGALVLAGAALAALRHLLARKQPAPPGLPGPDWIGIGLILGIVVVGFVLEAMRMAMTGYPAGSGYAFLGYLVSLAFTPGAGLGNAYGYVWYFHAVLTAAFVVYLPFGRMFHIILAPILLAADAAEDHQEHK